MINIFLSQTENIFFFKFVSKLFNYYIFIKKLQKNFLKKLKKICSIIFFLNFS